MSNMPKTPNQVGMGFDSPAIASHTFPEYTGAWNSTDDKHGEIITKDGRKLIAVARLSYQESNGLVITIDGVAKTVIYPHSSSGFFFKGNPLASVISDIACGLYPRLWTENEEALNKRAMMANKQNKRQRMEDERDAWRRMEAKQKELSSKSLQGMVQS